ncbi:MAG: zinc ribbon domain-containing protein [Firmicutes bacterium]|nr:zinc ribbon domain-containing protein [Bacillota bacterium]
MPTPSCGYLYKDLTLTERRWTCPACGVTHDRDHNAAKFATAGHRNGSTCGDKARKDRADAGTLGHRRENHACQRRSEPPDTSGASGREEAGDHNRAPTL